MSLLLENITLVLPEFTLLVSAEFTAPITGLSGPSGSGKTTLLEIIAGLRRPQEGRIVLQERTLTEVAKRIFLKPESRQVGYVPQDLALFPHYTAAGNLDYGYRASSHNAGLRDRVIAVLEIAPLLARSISQLSGGEQQRIALGRALLTSPKLLLLDEPLSSLDERLKDRIIGCLKTIHAEFKIPMIYVAHSASELTALCQEIVILNQGTLAAPSGLTF
jgi:molybdate transport system ATP-binding protein